MSTLKDGLSSFILLVAKAWSGLSRDNRVHRAKLTWNAKKKSALEGTVVSNGPRFKFQAYKALVLEQELLKLPKPSRRTPPTQENQRLVAARSRRSMWVKPRSHAVMNE